MESSAEQLVPQVAAFKLSNSFDQVVLMPDTSFSPLERDENFCQQMQQKLVGEFCRTSFRIIPGLIRFFIHFNYPPMHPVVDVLR